jgi:hypothetical protein
MARPASQLRHANVELAILTVMVSLALLIRETKTE